MQKKRTQSVEAREDDKGAVSYLDDVKLESINDILTSAPNFITNKLLFMKDSFIVVLQSDCVELEKKAAMAATRSVS